MRDMQLRDDEGGGEISTVASAAGAELSVCAKPCGSNELPTNARHGITFG